MEVVGAQTMAGTTIRSPTEPVPGMSMLKTSIELGNVGQFAVKPSRVPIASGRRAPQTVGRSRNFGTHRTRTHANGSAASLLDQASIYSGRTAASLVPSPHSLSGHVHLRSYERLPGTRSRSPYPIIPGPKGPRSRPISPAYSDSQASYSRPPYGASRLHGFRSPSPLSTCSRDRTPPGWHSRVHPLDPRQYSHGGVRPARYNGPSPMDTSMPKTQTSRPSAYFHPHVYSPRPIQPLPGSWPTEATWTPTPPPLFYDYSEAFQEQTYTRTFRSVPPTSFHQYAPMNFDQMYHELGGDQPRAAAAELAHETSPRNAKSKQQSSDSKSSSHSSSSEPREEAVRGSGPFSEDSTVPAAVVFDSAETQPEAASGEEIPVKSVQQPYSLNNETSTPGHQILTSYKLSRELLVRPTPIHIPSSRLLRKPKAAEGSNSSSPASMYSTETRPKSSEREITNFKEPEMTKETGKEEMEAASSVRVDQKHPVSQDNTGSPKEVTFKSPQEVTAPIIHAPMPERSISSPGQRQRFSQILSMEDIEMIGPPAFPKEVEANARERLPVQDTDVAPSTNLMHMATPRNSSLQYDVPSKSTLKSELHAISPQIDATSFSRPETNAVKVDNSAMKDLPVLPHVRSTTSLTPSWYIDPSAIHEGSIKSVADDRSQITLGRGPAPAPVLSGTKQLSPKPLPPVPPLKYKLNRMVNRTSTASLTNGHPWNLDENHLWTDDEGKASDITHDGCQEERPSAKRISKFKLRVSRTSVINSDTVRINKAASASTPLRRFSGSNDLFRGAIKRRSEQPKGRPKTRKRGSVHTRFIESLDGTPLDTPALRLAPLSSDLEIDVKEFFNDDTDQSHSKNSLRQQISNLKHKTSGASPPELTNSNGKGLSASTLQASRASKRSSVISVRSFSGASRLKDIRSKFVRRLKGWVLKGEERIHAWRARRRARKAESVISKNT